MPRGGGSNRRGGGIGPPIGATPDTSAFVCSASGTSCARSGTQKRPNATHPDRQKTVLIRAFI